MGYAAGVACLYALTAEDVPFLYAHLEPFNLFRSGWSRVDQTRSDWEADNFDPLQLMGPYGDDVPEDPTLDGLPDWVRDLRAILADPNADLGPDPTFGDLLLAHETRPSWMETPASARWLTQLQELEADHWLRSSSIRGWLDELVSRVVCEGRPRERARTPVADLVPRVSSEETYS